MKTLFLLMAQYEGRPIVSVDVLCQDFFSHLTPEKFLRKVAAGDIQIPIVRMEASRKSAKGVHLQNLASYLDHRREVALKEAQALYN